MTGNKSIATLILLLLLAISAYAQNEWESLVKEGDSWQYILPTAQLPADWATITFDDSSWSTGQSGIGYGDGDDQTSIATTISVYMRRSFTIVDLGDIERVLFHMDFDDGYVAYLNGTEISRAFMTGTPPLFDETSSGLHEAVLYQGFVPEFIEVPLNLIVEGENILSVEVHNENIGSSDLTANPFLTAKITTSGTYSDPPTWFVPPLVFESSDLPIVVIDTDQQPIQDDPKVAASIGIINNLNGARNNISDPFNELNWYCGIEFRGESSQSFDKKSYGFEIWDEFGNDLDTTFLNFPSEEDFILHGPYSDKSMLNNTLAMYLGNAMGQYASRTRFVELVINGDYKGVYVLMEKIKRDANRVDVSKLNPDEITSDDLTGGYIFRIDKGFYDGWSSNYDTYLSPGNKLYFQFYYPNQTDIVAEQAAYIENYMHEFEQAMAASDHINQKDMHYTDYIDLRSFVDTFILNELAKNIDGYRLSSYFHKEKDSKGGKVHAGPFWDFNLAFANADYCGGDNPEGWEYYQCQGAGHPFWWNRMLQDTIFTAALRCRWEELRSSHLEINRLNTVIDSLASIINESEVRNFQRWPIMGSYVWPNPFYFANAGSHQEVITIMKSWLSDRVNWMDANVPGIAEDCELYENYNYWNVILGLEDELADIELYPNPASDLLTIRTSEQILILELTDITGKTILERKSLSGPITLDLAGIESGVYLLRLHLSTGVVSKRIVIER